MLKTDEIKAFVPARDFALSRQFYTALGFTRRAEGGGIACFACFACSHCAFLLQDYYVQAFADNCVCWTIGQNTPGFVPVGRLP